MLVWSNGKYLLLRSRAVYGLNSDDSEIQKPKYGQVIKQRIKLLSFSAIMARTPSCAQSNRAKSCSTRSKWYCNRELTCASNTRARARPSCRMAFSGISPAVSKRPILSWPPGADITADLGRFGAWIEDSHGGAVQLASDYDRRSVQLPPAWSKYPNTLRDHSLQ